MAVAVKNTPESATRHPLNPLVIDSFAGALYVLGSLAAVFYGVPALWSMAVDPWLTWTAVSKALELVAIGAAGIGLIALGSQLIATRPVRGLRAGIFLALVEVLAIILITLGIGNLLERWLGDNAFALGIGITAAVGVGLCVLAALTAMHPRFERLAVELEDQGWFTVTPYKRTQGQRVRRSTILGILILAGCGIYTLLQHDTLAAGQQDFKITVPFTDSRYLVLLPDVRFTVPILLALASLWLAYRVVNLPVFADFLIATEAELNKVSWTTRKRLIQDTVVVLVTVLLLTVFLFVIDQFWGFILSHIGVLQISPTNAQQLGPTEQPW
jgi:preprotein translocase SecE subunit